ncbi:hypothetical protein ACHAXT_003480 [Thalassiosira profunda]
MDTHNAGVGVGFGEEAVDGGEDDSVGDLWADATLLDEQAWERVKSNDPTLTCLEVRWEGVDGGGGIDWENEGACLGANTHVKKLLLQDELVSFIHFDVGTKLAFDHFLDGITQNRTIEHVAIRSPDLGSGILSCRGGLRPFFDDKSNLRSLELRDNDRPGVSDPWSGLVGILFAMDKQSLERVYFESDYVSDETWGKVVEGLSLHQNLRVLSIEASNPGGSKNTLCAVKELLQSPICKLKELYLTSKGGFDSKGGELLAQGLAKQNTIRKLKLEGNKHIGAEGWASIGTSLQSKPMQLKELHLGGNLFDGKAMVSLGGALDQCTSLETLELPKSQFSGVKDDSWKAFWKLLTNTSSTLRKLDLYSDLIETSHIDDIGMTHLGRALSGNKTVTELNLCQNKSASSVGWRGLFTALHNPHTALQYLRMYGTNIDDRGIAALAEGLSNSSTARCLVVSHSDQVSPIGWQRFFQRWRNANSVLEEIHLHKTCINDSGVNAMVDCFAISGKVLKTLGLSNNDSITKAGWRAVCRLLQRDGCMLERLDIERDAYVEGTASIFANALVGNSHLQSFSVALNGDGVPATEWTLLSSSLCDRTSIETIYSSNHTLEHLLDPDDRDDDDEMVYESDLPYDLLVLLQLNRDHTKAEAARQKILRYHMQSDDGVNVDAFVRMELGTLPHAIAWAGRDSAGFPVLFGLVQSLPSLFESNATGKAAGAKRKRPE